MVKMSTLRKLFFVMSLAVVAMAFFAPMAMAQDHSGDAVTAETTSLGEGIRVAGLAIGAGLAMFGGAMGTGRAQASIGAGGTGALAEKPELFTSVLILVALPETIVVLGFVLGFLIIGS